MYFSYQISIGREEKYGREKEEYCVPGVSSRTVRICKIRAGVVCSAAGILCTAVPFYTVYRIIRVFLEASLHQAAVDPSQAWFWGGV